MEGIFAWVLLLIGAIDVNPDFFIAAGLFALAGRIGAFLDMLLYAEEEDGQ